MKEIPNSFDLMTIMHHTNLQLVEINALNQQNNKLKGSNRVMKFVVVGLLVVALVLIYKVQKEKTRD